MEQHPWHAVGAGQLRAASIPCSSPASERIWAGVDVQQGVLQIPSFSWCATAYLGFGDTPGGPWTQVSHTCIEFAL